MYSVSRHDNRWKWYSTLTRGLLNSLVSAETFQTEQTIRDATYAYKLKQEKKDGPSTNSERLNEIVDNVTACGELCGVVHLFYRCDKVVTCWCHKLSQFLLLVVVGGCWYSSKKMTVCVVHNSSSTWSLFQLTHTFLFPALCLYCLAPLSLTHNTYISY